MLGEARQALLLQRVGHGPAALTAREALEIATLGGAAGARPRRYRRLGPEWPPTSSPSTSATSAFAGAHHDPVAALLFCAPARAALTVIDGRIVVREGRLVTMDLPVLVERHNRLARDLVDHT